MNRRTQATLEHLKQAVWFSKLGVNDVQRGVVLTSWDEAIRYCSSVEWENLELEASNQYRERLLERSVERYRAWNETVDLLRPIVDSLVRERIADVVRVDRLPKVFEDSVQWDILHLLLEAEFADVCPPGFYAALGYWYTAGHFPCGWSDDYPAGTIVIY